MKTLSNKLIKWLNKTNIYSDHLVIYTGVVESYTIYQNMRQSRKKLAHFIMLN